MGVMEMIEMKYIVAAILYSFIGVMVFVLLFGLLDLLTPKVELWKELVEKQNIAVAIFLGLMALGIATIIASAIHG